MSTNIIELAATGSIDDVMLDMRVRSLFSLYYFSRVVLGYQRLVQHLHGELGELFLSRWENGANKQAIEVARGHFKTSFFTISGSVWIVLPVRDEDTEYALERLKIPPDLWFKRVKLHDRNATQLLAFENITNSMRKIKEIKWHFEENQLFRAVFPDIAYTGEEAIWKHDCLKIRRTGPDARKGEGTFQAIGVQGALQSMHFNIMWEDDCVGLAATNSEAVMEDTIQWHGLLNGALEYDPGKPQFPARFLVSNRWGYHDLNGWVRKHEPDVIFHTHSAIRYNSQGEEESTFPEEFPLQKLWTIRDSNSMTKYDFACQYLNSPVPPGEQEIGTDKLHFWTSEPDGLIKCSCGYSVYPSQLYRHMQYDPYQARGARSKSCPAVGVTGCGPRQSGDFKNHVFLLQTYTTKGTYGNIFDTLFTFNDKWAPHSFGYEDVGSQNMVEFYIRQQERRADWTRRRFPTITGDKPKGKGMEIRVRDYLFPVLRGDGNRAFSLHKSSTLVLNQLDTFPFPVFDHDYDILDMLAYSALHWRFPPGDEERRREKAAEQTVLDKLGVPYSHYEVAQ